MNSNSDLSRVEILLATYNGEKYLDQQINSLLKQSHQNYHILIRDDGSSDGTFSIIERHKNQSSGTITILPGSRNLGAAASFFELLRNSDNNADFFSFCDQDDIWFPHKIERAVTALSVISHDTPALYFSRVDLVDDDARFISKSPIPRKIGFGNALVENVATGCTVVMNKAARDLIVTKLPERCLMHDAWCYLVIACFGKLLFDDQSSMQYRQHSSNAIGAATSTWNSLVRRLHRFSLRGSGVFRFSNQAEKFLELYGEVILENKKDLLLKIVWSRESFVGRLRLAVNRKIWRQSNFDDLILRLLILLNRY